MTLTSQAQLVAEKRYFQKNDAGTPIEDADGLFRRVANAIALPEGNYGKLDVEVKMTTKVLYQLVSYFPLKIVWKV